jgi:hypothetical protein
MVKLAVSIHGLVLVTSSVCLHRTILVEAACCRSKREQRRGVKEEKSALEVKKYQDLPVLDHSPPNCTFAVVPVDGRLHRRLCASQSSIDNGVPHSVSPHTDVLRSF